eukprot:3380019-Pyramimonas_sp.AAC.1
MNSQPGTVPFWRPDSVSAQPPARHEPYCHKHGDAHPTAAQWWPLIWTPDLDLYARPMRCSALSVFDWEHLSADQIRPETGWDQWEREMEERGFVIPSVRVLT